MPDIVQTLSPAILLLAVGLAAIALAKPLKASPIIGFLIAGIAIGPHGFALVEQNDTTRLLAELGVMFLLFELGMHFTPKTLAENRKDLVAFAPLQVIGTAAAFAALAYVFGLPPGAAIVVGGALAISSTAVLVRILADHGQLTCPVGRAAISVSVAQDVFAIFVLIFAASLAAEAASASAVATEVGLAALKAVAGFAAALILGPLLLQPALSALVRSRNQEALTAAALLLALSLAALAVLAGLSLTLGGFLAGMMIGTTQYRPIIETEARPFRGLLLSFFFIAIGMSVDLGAVLGQWPLVIALALAIVATKWALATGAALIAGWKPPRALQVGALLASGSEFAFVILAAPAAAAAIGGDLVSVLIAAIALTLALTPSAAWLARLGAQRLSQQTPKPCDTAAADAVKAVAAPGARPIILYGMGEVGRRAADALKAYAAPFVAIEQDPERFRAAIADGYDVAFGDPSDLRLLDTIGATQARAIALSQSRYEISRDLTPAVQTKYPDLARFVAVEEADEVERHGALGMTAIRNLSHPRGLDFAAALLRFAGVAETEIMRWMKTEQARALIDAEVNGGEVKSAA
jgi:CPA2 family monovalent cation:H+ antiporter-2